MKNAGEFSDEDAYSDLDDYDPKLLVIPCPTCGCFTRPLCYRETKIVESGWTWIGLDYKAPFAAFETSCHECLRPFRFSTYTPQ